MSKSDVRPPLPDLEARAVPFRSQFERYVDWICWQVIEKRKQPKQPRRAESVNAWVKREAYRLLSHAVEGNYERTFRALVTEDKRSNRSIEEAIKNPFKYGLLAMFSDDSILSRKDRHVFGNQMLYAWLHDVPPEFLNAFLAISGGPVLIAEKLKEKNIEPGFEARYRDDRARTYIPNS